MTFEERRRYHRSFRYNAPRNFNPVLYKPVPPPYEPPQRAPRMGMPSGYATKVARQHEAFLLDPTNLEPIVVEEKEDQAFSKYATRWELTWSRLSIGWTPWRFIPIVDHDIMVVCHCGIVRGHELVYINDGAHGSRNHSLGQLLELGPVFVGTEQFYKEDNRRNLVSFDPPRTESGYGVAKYAVQTDIDGQVMAAAFLEKAWGPQAESVSFTPLAWLSLGKSLIQLGLRVFVTEGAVQGCRSVVRRIRPGGGGRALPPPKTFIPEGQAYIGVVRNDEILAMTSDTALGHQEFIARRLGGVVPPGAQVVSFGKYGGRIMVMLSQSYHGGARVASPTTWQAILNMFE